MDIKQIDILNALHVIQDVCQSNGSCDDCPFL